jgi:hypothetical protein
MPQTGSITPLHLKLILCQLSAKPQEMLTEVGRPHAGITVLRRNGEGNVARKVSFPKSAKEVDPAVAAALTGVTDQAKLFNRQARLNVPEQKVIAEVIGLWRLVTDALNHDIFPIARA